MSAEILKTALLQSIDFLLRIKGRLPLLRALVAELARAAASGETPIRNDAVLQLAHDSFDMLVIDLYSLRQRFIKQGGLFETLKAHCELLRRFQEGDHVPQGGFLGSPEDEEYWREAESKWMVARWNEVFDRLFPEGDPVLVKHVEALRLRFRADTKPTDDDRNKVRAHRYERHEDPTAAQALESVEQQVGVFERQLQDLLLVVARTGHSMSPYVFADSEGTARDLADLIIWGSINQATQNYGMTVKADDGNPRWYWQFRDRAVGRPAAAERPSADEYDAEIAALDATDATDGEGEADCRVDPTSKAPR